MSFLRHGQIYRPMVSSGSPGNGAVSSSVPAPIVAMSLQLAIPWRVALQQSPPPLHQPTTFLRQPAATVNRNHQVGGGIFNQQNGEFSVGIDTCAGEPH